MLDFCPDDLRTRANFKYGYPLLEIRSPLEVITYEVHASAQIPLRGTSDTPGALGVIGLRRADNKRIIGACKL